MKHLVLAIGIFAVSVWRSLANLVLQRILYLPRRGRGQAGRRLRVHIARGVVVTVMAFLFFWGIGRVPLAQGIALTFIAPLIALLLAALFLDEKIGRRSIAGSLAAFAGVVVIVLGQARAQMGTKSLLGIAAIIGSALCYADQHRPDAPSGARREAARDQLLPVADGAWRSGSPCSPSSARPCGPDTHWGWIIVASPAVHRRHPALRLGLCARRGELSRGHRI